MSEANFLVSEANISVSEASKLSAGARTGPEILVSYICLCVPGFFRVFSFFSYLESPITYSI